MKNQHFFEKTFKIIISLIFLTFSIFSLSLAQSSIKISGSVFEEDNGYPVSGAQIKILNTNYLDFSDNSGNFFFSNIPVGFYSIEVSAFGFEQKVIPDLEITEDLTRKIRVDLKRKTYILPGIKVTAKKISLPTLEPEIITKKKLEKLKVKTVSEALETMAGVIIQKTGTAAGTHQVTIRGSSPKQVLVLIDGQRINPSSSGIADLNTIPLEMVEKIEVYKGGASAKFGAGALGGAVNIITHPQNSDQSSRIKLDNMWGKWNTDIFNLSLKNPLLLKNLSTSFSYSYKYSKSDFEYEKPYEGKVKRENAYKRGTNLFLSGVYTFTPKTNLSFSAQSYNSTGGIPGAIFEEDISKGAKVKDKRKLLNLKLKHRFSRKFSVEAHFAFFRFEQHFQNLDLPPHLQHFFAYDSRYTENVSDFSLAMDLNPFQKNKLQIGSAFQKDGLDHKDLKFPQRSMGKVERKTKSFFVSDNQSIILPRVFFFENLNLNFSLRQDNTKSLNDFTSSRVGFAISRGKRTQIILRGDYGKSFRQPSNNALFWKEDVYASGNPDLQPEKAEHSEAGIEFKISLFKNSNLSWGSTYFHNFVKDIIVWRRRFDGKYMPQNISRSRLTGHEDFFSLSLFKEAVEISYRNTVTRALNKSGDITYDGKFIPFQPRYVTDLSILFAYRIFELSCKHRWVSERYRVEANTVKEDPYHLVDLNLELKKGISRWELRLDWNLKNLNDEKYFLVERYPMPGREWGIRLQIIYNLRE